jgi:hypothetical protein
MIKIRLNKLLLHFCITKKQAENYNFILLLDINLDKKNVMIFHE